MGMDMKWMEIGFTFIYLTMIWSIVIVETIKMKDVPAVDRSVASLFRTAFLFLIVGDSVLLLTRLVAFNVGSLEYSPFFLGGDVHSGWHRKPGYRHNHDYFLSVRAGSMAPQIRQRGWPCVLGGHCGHDPAVYFHGIPAKPVGQSRASA